MTQLSNQFVKTLPVESRLFFGTELNDFINDQYRKGWLVLTRFIEKKGADCLYEFQRVAR